MRLKNALQTEYSPATHSLETMSSPINPVFTQMPLKWRMHNYNKKVSFLLFIYSSKVV